MTVVASSGSGRLFVGVDSARRDVVGVLGPRNQDRRRIGHAHAAPPRSEEIVAVNANEAFVATMHGDRAQLEDEARRQQAVHGYDLDDLLTPTGTLDLARVADLATTADSAEVQPSAFTAMNRTNTTLLAFRQWMVAPVGVNGRPRIANNIGTCAIGSNHEGLTTQAGFTSGAQSFLNTTNSGLTLR